jgi:hypothetical protein
MNKSTPGAPKLYSFGPMLERCWHRVFHLFANGVNSLKPIKNYVCSMIWPPKLSHLFDSCFIDFHVLFGASFGIHF